MGSSKILVTGAAGFIGAAVAKKLVELGFEVITIDNLSTGYKEAVPKGVRLIEGNTYDESILIQLENNEFEAIMHIAGQSSGEISFDNPVYDLQSNAQSTLLLMKLALKTNCKKFIYASTMSVYGIQEEGAVNETALPVPESFYAVGKLASENYMRIYSKYGLACTALRLFNVYGPGQNLENMRQGMISIYLGKALKTGTIQVKGDKNRFRDMVYIDDVVNAFVTSLQFEKPSYQFYNVATGIKTTVGEVVDAIQKLFDKDIPVKYEGSTAGDVFGIYGSFEKLKNELNWSPQTSLNEGLVKMYNWAKNKV